MTRVFTVLILMTALAACNLTNPIGSLLDPFVYRITIQQGNIIDQEQVNKLRYGMNKEQVAFVLGTPLAKDAFDTERWEYPYRLSPPKAKPILKKLVILFKEDKLNKVIGDFETDKITTI